MGFTLKENNGNNIFPISKQWQQYYSYNNIIPTQVLKNKILTTLNKQRLVITKFYQQQSFLFPSGPTLPLENEILIVVTKVNCENILIVLENQAFLGNIPVVFEKLIRKQQEYFYQLLLNQEYPC
eukprot:TRINITY_DN7639_c0_g2_i1.p3 TRINITY_DN7639_c0_g2~~TRINITY_DN7639_c0_g2_i1.p3  ORF type:complete len:125 (+),score=1.91 TRINITY_DN7639_c0_g2_i1:628-1002(+)